MNTSQMLRRRTYPNFRGFRASDKLCGRMDRRQCAYHQPTDPCETPRNGRETAAKLAKHPVRDSRNKARNSARQPRDSRESYAKPCSELIALRAHRMFDGVDFPTYKCYHLYMSTPTDYWCTWLVAATSKWRFFAAQNSDNEKLEKPDRNDLRLGRALRMAPVPSKTNGQNLTYRI